MKTFILSDTHFKHSLMQTYCQRPPDFTERIIKNCHNLVRPEDTVIHLGDVGIGKKEDWLWIIPSLPGKKILVRGNHDDNHTADWWVEKGGFDFACDGLIYRGVWLTHKPADHLPHGCVYNIHGHLHNIWHGFKNPHEEDKLDNQLKNKWQRLFALEYTDYKPIEFDHFISHPDKYFARGINAANLDNFYKTGGK